MNLRLVVRKRCLGRSGTFFLASQVLSLQQMVYTRPTCRPHGYLDQASAIVEGRGESMTNS
jgi:hypothetical protein